MTTEQKEATKQIENSKIFIAELWKEVRVLEKGKKMGYGIELEELMTLIRKEDAVMKEMKDDLFWDDL